MEVQKGHFTRKADESSASLLCKPRIRFYSEIELLLEGDRWLLNWGCFHSGSLNIVDCLREQALLLNFLLRFLDFGLDLHCSLLGLLYVALFRNRFVLLVIIELVSLRLVETLRCLARGELREWADFFILDLGFQDFIYKFASRLLNLRLFLGCLKVAIRELNFAHFNCFGL